MNIRDIVYNECDTKECGGKFYTFEQTESGIKIKDCKCKKKLELYNKYLEAGIPIEFWNFNVENIDETFDRKILNDFNVFSEKIKMCVVNKVKFWFYGDNGQGKTTIAVLMLKEVLKAGYTGKIIKAFQLIKHLYNGEIDLLDNLDFIIIDELDKLPNIENTILNFSNVVADYMDKKSMIFISNKNMEHFKREKIYPEFFISRLKSFEKIHFKNPYDYRDGESIFSQIREVE